MMNKVKTIFLMLAGCVSMAMYPMSNSLEQRIVDREMACGSYLSSVGNGLYGPDYSAKIHAIMTNQGLYNALIERVEHLASSYRNDVSVLVRSRGKELRMNSFVDLQNRIKEAIDYNYNFLRQR